jgi:hypothetical protein
MSQFVSDEQIKLLITKVTETLNKCIRNWYIYTIPTDLEHFKGCCDKDEINLLIKCYNIFSENKKLQFLDYDAIKALVMYYYIVVVFENYVTNFIDKKYLKIVDEEKSNNVKTPNLYFFTDNDDNEYAYYWTNDVEPYIEIEDQDNDTVFYARNTGRETHPYIYQDKELKNKVKSKQHINCFEKMLTTEKSKEYYDLLYRGSEDYLSQIRRLILNMNTKLFEGHKGGKKNTKKNKRNLKKYVKKSRKNKGKKRINKIKYTKK